MLDITHKRFSFKKHPDIPQVERLLASPEKFFCTFSPDLPNFVQIKNISIDTSTVKADFLALFPIELDAKLNSFFSKKNGLVRCQLDLQIIGGSPAKDKIYNNVKKLRATISYSYRANLLSIRLQYEKGDNPSSSLLHTQALNVISRQAKPIANALYSNLS